MISISDLNVDHWVAERQIIDCPAHFTRTTVNIDDNLYEWVCDHTKGRFSIVDGATHNDLIWERKCFAFEDPKEAFLLELTWS
jgi:hypothetical protein